MSTRRAKIMKLLYNVERISSAHEPHSVFYKTAIFKNSPNSLKRATMKSAVSVR